MVTGKWTPALLLSLTFLLGLSLGYIVRDSVLDDGNRRGGRPPFGPGRGQPEFGPAEMLDRMARALELSDQQRVELDRILESSRTKMMAIRSDVRPRQRAIEDSTRAAIENLLTEEQLMRFDVMRRNMRGRPGGPRPGGGRPPF